MSNSWSKAAENYRAAEAAKSSAEEHGKIRDDKALLQQLADIDRAVDELEEFVRTEGQTAMELLGASKRHFIFGEENEGGGFGTVYFIDGNGLQMSYEAMGMWIAYSQEVPKPRLSIITARQAVMAAVQHGHMKAAEVVSRLRSELDKIAQAAPAAQ